MMNAKKPVILSVLLLCLAGAACCQDEMNETMMSITPSVEVSDQMAVGNGVIADVTVAEVVSDGPGWIVIHNDLFGHPGGVIGYAHVEDGSNSNISVTIHSFVATEKLFAVLHYDRGVEEAFEYPLPDIEQKAEDQIVIEPFSVSTSWNGTLINLTQMAREADLMTQQ